MSGVIYGPTLCEGDCFDNDYRPTTEWCMSSTCSEPASGEHTAATGHDTGIFLCEPCHKAAS